jgi:ubiquinone/menaquinone biosynthesis C-methylase UbiE
MMLKIKPDEFKEWNEKMIAKYDPDAFHHHSNSLIRFVESRRVKVIFKLLDLRADDAVLEVGCGAGNVIERASFGRLFGVDLSTSILIKAKRHLGRRIHLFKGDAQSLPCKDESFQHVICSEVLEHLLDPSIAMSEMERVLKPGGSAVISIPNELWINRIKRVLIRLRVFQWFVNRQGNYHEMPERMDEEWHLHSLSLEGWLNMFKKLFKIARFKSIPFRWLPLRYVILLKK